MGNNDDMDASGRLEAIVQARFQNHEVDKGNDTTPVFKGPNPAWNTPLKLRPDTYLLVHHHCVRS